MDPRDIPGGDLGRILAVEHVAERAFTTALASWFGEAQSFDLLARAVLAVLETGGELPLVQVHARYLRRPRPLVPLRLTVESVDETPSHCLRRVRVSGDELVAEVTAALGARGDGPEWEPRLPDSLAKPEDLPSTHEVAKREGWEQFAAGPLEFRRQNPVWPPAPEERLEPHREWLRPRAALPPEPRLHTAALAFASQFYPQWAFEWRAGADFRRERFAILDHSLWLHAAARWDDWWFVDAHSDVSRGGRALAHRRVFARDGRLLATATHTAAV